MKNISNPKFYRVIFEDGTRQTINLEMTLEKAKAYLDGKIFTGSRYNADTRDFEQYQKKPIMVFEV